MIPSTIHATRSLLKERLSPVIDCHIADTQWMRDIAADPDVAAGFADGQVTPR